VQFFESTGEEQQTFVDMILQEGCGRCWIDKMSKKDKEGNSSYERWGTEKEALLGYRPDLGWKRD